MTIVNDPGNGTLSGNVPEQSEAMLRAVAEGAHLLLGGRHWETGLASFLELLGRASAADRCGLIRLRRIAGTYRGTLTHEWSAEQAPQRMSEYWADYEVDTSMTTVLECGDVGHRRTSEASRPDSDALERERSAVSIHGPIRVNGSLWGTIGLDDCTNETRCWSEGETAILRAASDILSAAIEREHAADRESRRESILAAVASSAGVLLRHPDWRRAASGALALLGAGVGASRAYVFEVVGREGDHVRSKMTHEWTEAGIEATIDRERWADTLLSAGNSAAFLAGDPIVRTRESASPSLQVEMELEGTLSLIGIPIFVDGVLWGSLGFDDCREPRNWDAGEIDALRAAAQTISAAVTRERAYDGERRRDGILSAEAAIAEVMLASDSWRQALSEILALLGRATGADRATATLVRSHGDPMMLSLVEEWLAPGVPPSDPFWADHPALSSAPAAVGQPILWKQEGLGGAWGDALVREGTLTWLDLPVVVDGRVELFIGLDDCTAGRAWTELELDALRTVTGLVGAGIMRERAALAMGESDEIIRAVAASARLLLQAASWREVVPDVLAVVGGATRATHAYLFESSADGPAVMRLSFEWARPGVAPQIDNPAWQTCHLDVGEVETLQRGDCLAYAHPELPDHHEAALAAAGTLAYLEVPVFVDGRVWGLLGFDDAAVRVWDRRELEGLRAAADVLAAAIEREQAVLAARETSARLQQAQKLELAGRVAGGLAHDFNNYLTVVHGYAELLKDEDLGGAKEDLDRILEATRSATELARRLLQFARPQPEVIETVDLTQLVLGLTGILSALSGPNVRLRVLTAAESAEVEGDPTQLRQVVMNLVLNASEAMGGAGDCTISIAVVEGEVVLSVTDTGPGIDPDVLEHVFEPFFTTRPDGGGTGLGLATVRSIVVQLGGTIDVRSASGAGTSFVLRLPGRVPSPAGPA